MWGTRPPRSELSGSAPDGNDDFAAISIVTMRALFSPRSLNLRCIHKGLSRTVKHIDRKV